MAGGVREGGSAVVPPGAKHALVLELGLPPGLLRRRVPGVGNGTPVAVAAEEVEALPGTPADRQPRRGADLPFRAEVPATPGGPVPPVDGRVADDGQPADLPWCRVH